jgi:UDP-N-acetylglucosamine 2-epimerase
MRVLTVIGARPQFIKAALLSEAFERRGVDEVVVHTGQHYDDNMSDVFFRELQMKKPAYFLQVGSASHAQQTAQIMERLEPVVTEVAPDIVLVYGDTNSTLAGALVAVKLNVPLGHVEAGLRSFNRAMPEEINRILTDRVSSILFAPTETSRTHLASEGITEGVFVVGDLMVDLALRTAAERILPNEQLNASNGTYALATIHRASNTDDPHAFTNIIAGLRALPFQVIFPVHPRTIPLVREAGVGKDDNIIICDPLPYREMIALVAHARVVLTDSGGLQKESVVIGTPCVTLRDETEWVETLENGWNVLAGTDPVAIVEAAMRAVPQVRIQPFGDGNCAMHITDALLAMELRTPVCAS